MKKAIIVIFLSLAMNTFAMEPNDFFQKFINKQVEVEYANNSGQQDHWKAKGTLESVSEYGVIVKTKKGLIFINHNSIMTIQMKN